MKKIFCLTLLLTIAFAVNASAEYRNLSLTPGRTASEMRFTWHLPHSQSRLLFRPQGEESWIIVVSDGRPLRSDVPTDLYVHQPSVGALSPNAVYEYKITWRSGNSEFESEIKNFRTAGASEFSFFAVSDPQIAGSRDGAGWANTMQVAATAFPDAQFVISMGDQVASSSSENNLERAQRMFNYLFAPPELHRLPFAPVAGNHDAYHFDNNNAPNVNPQLWHYHYNTPIRDPGELGEHGTRAFYFPTRQHNPPTQFDYYFRYGNVLFIVMAFYNYQTTTGRYDAFHERAQWFAEVMEQNADADWRVAAFHMPTYSAHRSTAETSAQRVRENWVPVFEETGIDIAFMGHDHIYSRTHHMRGVELGGLPGTPVLEQNWASEGDNAVIDPVGITYIAFGGASGHNLRDAAHMPRSYIARYHQAHNREFSVVSVTPYTFSVATYMIDGEGIVDNTITMTDIYTMVRGTHPAGIYIPAFRPYPRPVFVSPWDSAISAARHLFNLASNLQ